MKNAKDFLVLVALSAVSYVAVDVGFTLGKALCDGVKTKVKSCKKEEEEIEEEEEFFE